MKVATTTMTFGDKLKFYEKWEKEGKLFRGRAHPIRVLDTGQPAVVTIHPLSV